MKKIAVALTLLLAALALVACGGSDETTSGATSEGGAATEAEGTEAEGGTGGGSVVEIEANPEGQLAYTSTEETAEAGEVTIEFTNESPIGHDVDIEDENGEIVVDTDVISEDDESETVELEPGEYTFYCSVPGHREAGMEGTLIVE